MRRLIATPITGTKTPETLAPFCELITPPAVPGERAFYHQWLGSANASATPRLHVNYVPETALPYTVPLLEKHPYAAQIFLPLEASGYLIVVAPSLADGSPALDQTLAFLAPGNIGVLYRANTWHAGATAIGGKAHFAVHMWRNDIDDDVFFPLDTALQIEL